jgi:CheY-like chemotaxis protein
MGCEVTPATSAGEALDLLAKQPVDGVLLDDTLPGASGVTVRSRMKTLRPDIPVFLFAGVNSQTRFMVRFFDAYLRRREQIEDSRRFGQ